MIVLGQVGLQVKVCVFQCVRVCIYRFFFFSFLYFLTNVSMHPRMVLVLSHLLHNLRNTYFSIITFHPC